MNYLAWSTMPSKNDIGDKKTSIFENCHWQNPREIALEEQSTITEEWHGCYTKKRCLALMKLTPEIQGIVRFVDDKTDSIEIFEVCKNIFFSVKTLTQERIFLFIPI